MARAATTAAAAAAARSAGLLRGALRPGIAVLPAFVSVAEHDELVRQCDELMRRRRYGACLCVLVCG
jgi:hypothetical protein